MRAIDEKLVRDLVSTQFPQWDQLPINAVGAGWDNRSFRLGNDMVVRLPSASVYEAQVEKEHRWLPLLAPLLPVPIPAPVGLGRPTADYPFKWSVYRWIEGESVASTTVSNSNLFAAEIAAFLTALERIEVKGGPAPGAHNFHRGGALRTYDSEVRKALQKLAGKIDTDAATRLWDAAIRTAWNREHVWVHGDISIGNLLVREQRLVGVIDFGLLATGDPACDFSVAWTVFRGEARDAFESHLQYDEGTRLRARAWALWKALIIAAELDTTNAAEWDEPLPIIEQLLH